MNNSETYKNLFYQTMRIRLVEEKIIELYPSDLIQSPVHLSIGQEAAAVGVCANLNLDDWVFINYRGHAFYLAKGGPMPEFFAKRMGKAKGKLVQCIGPHQNKGLWGLQQLLALQFLMR